MPVTLFFPLLTGGILLLAGGIQYFFPPKKINGIYGYRTANSMKSQKHWECAQLYSAKYLSLVGLILIVLSPIGLFFNWDEEKVVLVFISLLIGGIVLVLIKTERFLKNIPNEEE